MHIVQTLRERKREVGARQCILGVASIDRVSSKRRVVAQILHAVVAVPAIPIDAADPGDADAAPSGSSAVAPSTTSPTIW